MSEIVVGLGIWVAFLTGCAFLFVAYCLLVAWVTDQVWRRTTPTNRQEFLHWWWAKRHRAALSDDLGLEDVR